MLSSCIRSTRLYRAGVRVIGVAVMCLVKAVGGVGARDPISQLLVSAARGASRAPRGGGARAARVNAVR